MGEVVKIVGLAEALAKRQIAMKKHYGTLKKARVAPAPENEGLRKGLWMAAGAEERTDVDWEEKMKGKPTADDLVKAVWEEALKEAQETRRVQKEANERKAMR